MAQLEPWTYSGDPASSPKDAVRFIVGDIHDHDRLRRDTEITFALTTHGGDTNLAGAMICDSLAAEYSRLGYEMHGDVSKSLLQKSVAYSLRAAELRERARTGATGLQGAVPFLGGVSNARAAAAAADPDLPQPAFRPGMFDDRSC